MSLHELKCIIIILYIYISRAYSVTYVHVHIQCIHNIEISPCMVLQTTPICHGNSDIVAQRTSREEATCE